MEEQDAGNYTCKCGNEFGETDFSQPSELVFLPGSPSGESGEGLLGTGTGLVYDT